MYRAILAEGEVKCDRYEMGPHGVDLFDDEDRMVAFVPYQNLHAVLDEETYAGEDPSTM